MFKGNKIIRLFFITKMGSLDKGRNVKDIAKNDSISVCDKN